MSRWEAFLNDQERRGKLRRARRNDAPMRRLTSLRGIPRGIDVARLLDETRADRR
jgi:hypothetical protein